MRRLVGSVALFIAAVTVSFIALTVVASGVSAVATRPNISSDVRLLPQRSDVRVQYLPAMGMPRDRIGHVLVTPAAALTVAEREFGLTDQSIDPNAGVVRAYFTARGQNAHQQERVYIVTADVNTPSQVPGSRQMYTRLCIVISATTGRYELAYTARPLS